jgi:hypothetical protein
MGYFPDTLHKQREQRLYAFFSTNRPSASRFDNLFDMLLDFFRGHRLLFTALALSG